jgi:hypothetical protein
MAIYYIDIDDEITSAAARIRDASDTRIALVVQGGSRVATSRINFRLLAREARKRGRTLAIIAADASVRSMVQTAGLPVFASVGDYQKAEAGRTAASETAAPAAVGEAMGELATTVDTGADGRQATLVGSTSRVGGYGQPPARSRRRFGVGAGPLLALGLVAIFIVVGVGAFLLWPSATIVLTLEEEPVAPLSITIKVDPALTATNDTTLTVPGVAKEFGVQASATFNTTGQNVVDTAATGTVTFTSCNTGSAVLIPAGTQVETAAKVAFATTPAVTVPKAGLSGLTCIPSTAQVGVAAVKKGLSGNVAAGAIVNVPPWLATALVLHDQVTNKTATAGGTHTVTPFVQQSDIDAAETSLNQQLASSVQAQMTDPSSVAAGFELFPSTTQMGSSTFNPDPSTLLNQGVSTFDLTATGSATATAANLATVRTLADRKIRSEVKAGHAIVEGSVSVSFGSPTTEGAIVSVPVAASAMQAATVDQNKLRADLKGKSAADATAYLAQYGSAAVSISPFWASTITGFDFRVDLRVVAPTAVAPSVAPTVRLTPEPRRTATPTTAPQPTGTATATGSPPATPTSPGPTPTPVVTPSILASPTTTP